MITKKGVYVFPTEKDCFRLFTCDGETFKELPSTTYAKQIIDFAEINLQVIIDVLDKIKSFDFYENGTYDYERLHKTIEAIYYILACEFNIGRNPIYSALLKTEMENKVEGTVVTNNYELDALFARAVNIIEHMVIVQQYLYVLCSTYCYCDGSHNEKVIEALKQADYIFSEKVYSEITYASVYDGNKLTLDAPVCKGYHFDTLEDYFLFMISNLLRKDINFSMCAYCGHFFIPKTKKKTRYCDRVRTETNRTCKDIGPEKLQQRMRENSEILNEYKKAVERYRKRYQRTEDRHWGHVDKTLHYEEYSEWLDCAKDAKRKWLDRIISDEDFLKVIHALD